MRPTALITGASRGIGRAIALRLADRYDLALLARDADDLAALAREAEGRGARCTSLAVDLADPAAVADALAEVEVDVLVNNAGVGVLKPFLELAPDEWARMIDVNVNAVYHVTRAVLPGMVRRGRGHVVNVSSIAGRSAFANGTAYAATKAFLNSFSESLYLEVRDHGVRVSVVQPGAVATHFAGNDPDAPRASWKLRPDDVAQVVDDVLGLRPEAMVFQVEVRARSKS